MKISDGYKKLKKRIDSYVKRFPLPSKEENTKYFVRLREIKGQEEHIQEYTKIRDKLILSNGGFGMKYAIKYCVQIHDESIIEDIFQQAQLGIVDAVDRFDPNYGVNFTTFAFHHIKNHIVDFIKNNKIVSAPRNMARNIRNVSVVRDYIYSESGSDQIESTDIRERLIKEKGIDLKEGTIDDIIQLIDVSSATSDESFVSNLVDEIPYIERHEKYILIKSIIMKDLDKIDPEVQDIIKMRFGIEYDRPYSLQEIMFIRNMSQKQLDAIKDITRYSLNK